MKLFCIVFAAACLLVHPSPQPLVKPHQPSLFSVVFPKRIPILMYHYVEYVQDKGDTIRQSLAISPATFALQIETLVNAGYTFLTAKELGELFDGTKLIPNKPIVLTFDDGYRDFYTDVYPLLKRFHIKATVYVIAGFIDFKNYMKEEQLDILAKEGLVEIGAHTVHHVSLPTVSEDVRKKELEEGKMILEKITGYPVVSFAYPNGQYDDASVGSVKEAGFTTAVGTKQGVLHEPSNRFILTRIRPGGLVGTDLLTRIVKE